MTSAVTIDAALVDSATCYTVIMVARRWRCDQHTPLAAIHAGQLIAIDISRPGSRRRRWRITPEALADYERRRSTAAPAAKKVRRPPVKKTWREYV